MGSPYTGLWKRVSLQLGEAPPVETEQVYWLQAETHFADLRVPIDFPRTTTTSTAEGLLPLLGVKAFAGTTTLGTHPTGIPWIRWTHTLDFNPQPGAVDQGDVWFEGSDLIETGQWQINQQWVSYRERWVRQPLSHSGYAVLMLEHQLNHTSQHLTYPKGLWVIVGDFFLRQIDWRSQLQGWQPSEPVGMDSSQLSARLQFQADLGQMHEFSAPWQIRLSNWPHRVGRSLQDAPAYHLERGETHWIESWISDPMERWERHWRIVESSP